VSVVKTVLMVIGAGCVGATVAVFALMDDLTRIERSAWNDRSCDGKAS